MITERKVITRQMLRQEPDTLFVFGDNIARRGLGGQAKEMRGEHNAIGIPTKWIPTNEPHAFFHDVHFPAVKPFIDQAFRELRFHLSRQGSIVWPADGVGTGLADLPNRAPRIAKYIDECRANLNTGERK